MDEVVDVVVVVEVEVEVVDVVAVVEVSPSEVNALSGTICQP